MKLARIALPLLSASALVLAATAASAAPPDAKTTFTTMKCNNCHSVQSAGIEAVPDPEAEGDEEAPKPKDLSDVGSKHDAKWIKDWLSKKAEKDGKTHRKKFTGTGAEMEALATWLAGMKTPAK